jgi:hypothetical protein
MIGSSPSVLYEFLRWLQVGSLITNRNNKSTINKCNLFLFIPNVQLETLRVFFVDFIVPFCAVHVKEQWHELFDPRFFTSINPTYMGPDSRPKAVLHMASYSPRKLIIFAFPRGQCPRGNGFSGVNHPAEAFFPGVIDPAEICCKKTITMICFYTQ